MAIADRMAKAAEKLTQKANEWWTAEKLRARIHTETAETEGLKSKMGEICFGKYRAGDPLDPEIESLCREVEKHRQNIAENKRKLEQITAAGRAADPSPDGRCPYCGEDLPATGRFCPGCGQKRL